MYYFVEYAIILFVQSYILIVFGLKTKSRTNRAAFKPLIIEPLGEEKSKK
jgi:hypothetical protein